MELTDYDKYLYNSFNYKNHIIPLDSHNFNNNNKNNKNIDLSDKFPEVYNQKNKGITSSCAIAGIMSYYMKKYYNTDKLFSPYYLAYNQYMHTQNWQSIDLFTGINIVTKYGICSNYLVDENTEYNVIDTDFISNDAINYKIHYTSKINFTISNIIELLNDEIPILCSIKIIPSVNNNKFFNYLNNNNYWELVQQFYINTSDDNNINIHNIYSVSIIIVGYSDDDQLIKIRGCWGDSVGDHGYFYIPYSVINDFSDLFFDYFIIDIKNNVSCNNHNLNLFFECINTNYDDLYDSNNELIFKLNDISPQSTSSINSVYSINSDFNKFKKISSHNLIDDLNSSFVSIENIDDYQFINNENLFFSTKLSDSYF